MKSLNVTISHELTQVEALKRTKKLLASVKKDFGNQVTRLKQMWKGTIGNFSFTIKGFPITGSIEVTKSDIILVAEAPFAVMLFKGKIEKVVGEKAREVLE